MAREITDEEIRTAIFNDLTVPLWPHTARALGLSKNPVYQAARRGEIQVLRFGGRICTPTASLRRMLGIEPAAVNAAHTSNPANKAPPARVGADASGDCGVVAAWWEHVPAANIGIAIPKGMFVVDLDGEQACRDWLDICSRRGAPPPTLAVLTGRGRHLYFRSSVEVKNSTGRIAEGIDTRGRGGYTIAPPSVHPSGAVYSLDRRCFEVAEAPRWLVGMAIPKEEAPRTKQHYRLSDTPLGGLKGVIGTVANARQGERNALAFWGACRAAELVGAGGIAEHFAEQLLVEAASCAGLSHTEARVTVRSGLKTGARGHG